MQKFNTLFIILIAHLVMGVTALSQEKTKQYSRIVSVDWLSEHLIDPDLVILHVASLRLEYNREHIPYARFLWPNWLSTSTPDESIALNPNNELKKTLESLGISNSSKIVLTSSNMMIISTCRVFLALDYLGLGDQTYILDGGIDQWKADGKAVTVEITPYKKGKLKIFPKVDVFYSADRVLQNLKTPNIVLIDVRQLPIYDGKAGSPRAGHIPGAKNLPLAKLTEEKTFKFLPKERLREEFQKIGVKEADELVTYCAVGASASVLYFVARELGYMVHLYDGSMDEWGNRFELPMEKTE